MPTIEEKIEASKAIEAELLSQLLALPGAEVVDEKGYDLLHSIKLQHDRTWELSRFATDRHFGLQGQLSCAQQLQQSPALMNTDGLGPAGPAPEPEPPTLVATEPPAPPAEAPAPEAPVAEPV